MASFFVSTKDFEKTYTFILTKITIKSFEEFLYHLLNYPDSFYDMDKSVFLKFAKESFVKDKKYIFEILEKDISNSEKALEILQHNKIYFTMEEIFSYKKDVATLVALNQREYDKYIAKKFVENFDLLKAKDMYRKLLEEGCEIEVVNNYACTCIKLCLYEEAIEVFRNYYKVYIDYNLYYNYVKVLLTSGLTKEALDVVRYYEEKGDKSKALFLFGKVKIKMGDYVESFQLFENSLLIERDYHCLKEYITTLVKVQKYQRALEVIEKNYNKDDIDYYYNRAKVFQKNKLIYEAIDELTKALAFSKSDNTNIMLYTFIGKLYRENNEVQKGIQHIRNALFIKNSGANYELLLELAKLNKASGNMGAYKDNLSLILNKFKENY